MAEAFIQLSHEAQQQGIAAIAISSNSVITHPQDGPDKMAEDAQAFGKHTVLVCTAQLDISCILLRIQACGNFI